SGRRGRTVCGYRRLRAGPSPRVFPPPSPLPGEDAGHRLVPERGGRCRRHGHLQRPGAPGRKHGGRGGISWKVTANKEPQGVALCRFLHRSSETFWTTTGMFPQEFIIGFPKSVTISRVAIQCYLVRSLRIERSVSKDPVDFEECVEKDLQHTEGQLQMEEFPLPDFQATYLRFIIKSAFDHFVSVHRVMAEGTAEDT
uniref:Heat shock protein family B (small) member 11 n=1 Tax=Gallus gallus TaxID=9031 RepID=A0A8V1A4I0_CHICK